MLFPSLKPHLPGRRPPGRSFGDLFDIAGPVGPEAENARDDVIRAQILLGQTGDLDLDSLGGPTGWPGGELTRGLQRYQRRKGLTVDGLMLPDGETINALQDDLFDSLTGYRAPTTAEVDGFHDRLARYRANGNEDVEPPRLELPRAEGRRPRLEALPRGEVRSDIDVGASPEFTAGAQVAQLAEAAQLMQAQATANAAAGAVGSAGASKLPPGVTPEIDKVTRQLEKWVGDKINLLTMPVQMQRHLSDGAPVKLPSALLDPAIEAAVKTPPLKPDVAMPSVPPSLKQEDITEIEEFIRHEGKDWIEGFSALDQKFIRDLMIQQIHHHGMLGKPATRETDLKVAKMMTEIRNAEYPELTDLFRHLYGSYFEGDRSSGDQPMKQEVITNGPNSRVYPDITFGHPTDPEARGRINTITGNMREIAPAVGYFNPTTDERFSFQAVLNTMAGGVAQMIPKTWTLNDDALWEQYAQTACRMVLEGIKTQLHEKGYLKQADERPKLPEPGEP